MQCMQPNIEPNKKATIDHDPDSQLYLDEADNIIADPKVRALRLALYVSNRANARASAANALQAACKRLLAPPPPPPRRWRCQRLHHHGRIIVEAGDAR